MSLLCPRGHLLGSALIFLGVATATASLFKCAPNNDAAACAALGDLYYAAGGSGWKGNEGFESAAAGEETDYCTMFSADTFTSSCDASGSLTQLLLGNNLLVGSIPDSIGQLSSLTSLLLDGNNLTGTIPSSICRLTRLSTLLLDTNYLYGSIPECIGQLTQLFFLDMRNNSLTGSIPSSIGLLTRLKYLFLNINMLVGTIPDFGALTMVKTMLLDDNNLGGVIPASLGKMTDMRYLNLSSNYLNSSIPESLGLLTQLQSLVVFDNELTGTLPSITSLTDLFHLDLSSNSGLCGDLPGSLIQGDTQRVKLSSCVDSTDVPSRRLLSQDSSFTSTFAHAFDLQSATPLRDVGGAALDPESAWTASSSASGVVQLVVGPRGSLGGALRITLTALYSTARSAWFTAFDVDGVSFAFHPGPMDVGEDDPSFGGVRGAVLPNIGIFANNNGESSRCSVAFYLANEADGATKDELPSKYATWGLNTFANLTFHVDADGHPSVPTDGEGLPFQRVPIHNGGSTPGCTRVTLEPGADLIFGRGFGEAADSFSEIGHIHFIALSPALR